MMAIGKQFHFVDTVPIQKIFSSQVCLKQVLQKIHCKIQHFGHMPEMSAINEILKQIPAEFERVRIMRLKAGTKIEKHTDKVDKSIGFDDGQIVRIHVPIKTDQKVIFSLYEGKDKKDFFFETGNYYYADVTKAHEVHNTWDQDRLHLVADCYSNETIRNLILE
jgi:type IV secretory pathway VirB9-like protein